MRKPRTDAGTVVIHWVMATGFVAVVATGLRIASDEPQLRWLHQFDSILPAENVWYLHVVAGLGFGAAFVGYLVYIAVARLGRRTRVDRGRWSALFRAGKPRWSAVGAVVVWTGAVAFAIEIASGTLLYLGWAGLPLSLHRDIVWLCLVLPLIHVLAHLLYGGVPQVLRIVRPTRLVSPPREPDVLALLAEHVQMVDDLIRCDDLKAGRQPRASVGPGAEAPEAGRRRPLLAGAIAGVAFVAMGWSVDQGSGMRLLVPAIRGLNANDVNANDSRDRRRPVRSGLGIGASGRGPNRSGCELRRSRRLARSGARRARRPAHILRVHVGGPDAVAQAPSVDQNDRRLARGEDRSGFGALGALLRGPVFRSPLPPDLSDRRRRDSPLPAAAAE